MLRVSVFVLVCAVGSVQCVTPHTTHSKEMVTLNGSTLETEETDTESVDKNGMITETSDWEMKIPNSHPESSTSGTSKSKGKAIGVTHPKEGKPCTDRAFADVATGTKICGKADTNPIAHCDDPVHYQAASYVDENNKLHQHAGQFTAAEACCACGGGLNGLTSLMHHNPTKVPPQTLTPERKKKGAAVRAKAIAKALEATKALKDRWDAVSKSHPKKTHVTTKTKSVAVPKAKGTGAASKSTHATPTPPVLEKKKLVTTTSASNMMKLLPLWIGLGISGLVAGGAAAVYFVQGGKVFPKFWGEDAV